MEEGNAVSETSTATSIPLLHKTNWRYWMSRNVLLGSWMLEYFKFMGEKSATEHSKDAEEDEQANNYSQGWKMRCC